MSTPRQPPPEDFPPGQVPLSREAASRPLDCFFSPRSVAVIGASNKAGSVGRAVLENVFEFGGKVYAVNPKRTEVLQLPAYPNIGAVPAKVDLAVITTPARTVPGIVRECAQAGVKGVIVISAGFKEAGAEGAALEAEILEAARQGGVRVIGPNCLGLMAPHVRLNATFATTMARPGSVAFISQSGALCSAVLDWSLREHVGFSAFVSVGSMLDVGWADLIDHLGDDPHTRSIVMYMESIGHARSFISAAREVAFHKPIIVVKVGRTAAAAQAAASHTGSLTGSDDVLDAAFRRAGVLRVDTIEDLFDMAEVLGKQPRPRGPRLAILTNAGGPAALAVDRLVAGGGQVARLADATVAELDRVLPPHWSHGNPVDILGDADERRYAKALEIVARDSAADGVLAILSPQAMTDALGTAEKVKAFAALEGGKPLLASWMGGTSVEEGERVLNEAGVPTYRYPDRAAQAFDYMWRYSSNLNGLYETPALPEGTGHELADRQQAAGLITGARERGRVVLSEHESKQVLAAYGVPVVETRTAATEEAAVAAATALGFPVALKLHSETITHKAAVGGVRLNVRDAADVRTAWQGIRRDVTEKAGARHFLGVAVQRMIPPEGFELILGSSVDPQCGPVLLFGAGGRLVEVMQDRALGFPPLNSTLARRLMEQTRIYRALQGTNGRPAVDLAALEQVLVRFSQLVAEQRQIREIDINPLFISADRVVALDARVILHEAGVPAKDLPALAIRPYPQQYVSTETLANGTPVVIRPIRPEDEPAMVKFHETLSDRSVYNRYFNPRSLADRVAHARLARLCFIDYDREMALVAVRENPAQRQPEILGVARLIRVHGRNEGEFALVVSDQWQRHGLGTLLLTKLVAAGRSEGLQCISGETLADNLEMQRVCERAGFTIRRPAGQTECVAEIVL